MSLLAVPFEQITEADLNALVAQKVPESIVLDYKRDLVAGSDKDRHEFLADVSSFANTTGGEILFGIEEANGLPIKLVGINASNIDQEILRLDRTSFFRIDKAMSSLLFVASAGRFTGYDPG